WTDRALFFPRFLLGHPTRARGLPKATTSGRPLVLMPQSLSNATPARRPPHRRDRRVGSSRADLSRRPRQERARPRSTGRRAGRHRHPNVERARAGQREPVERRGGQAMMTDVLLAVLAIEVPVVGFILWREMVNTFAYHFAGLATRLERGV